MNITDDSNLLCPCKTFLKDLLMLSRAIYSDTYEQQCKKLELFAKLCFCQEQKMINDIGSACYQPCSHDFCSLLLEKRDFIRQNGSQLTTLVMNFICYIYRELSIRDCPGCCSKYVRLLATEICLKDNILCDYRVLVGFDGRCELMKMLLNLNLISTIDDCEETLAFKICRDLNDIRYLLDSTPTSFNLSFRYLLDSTLSNERELMKLLEHIFSVFNISHYEGCFNRICLALVATKATLYKMKKIENRAKEYICCLRMYFAATLDPLLTVNEMRCTLYACLILLKKLHLFEPLYEEFIKFMPECPVKLEPRNLTHLARCQIRENIRMCNVPLQATVRKLCLPQLLKEFVLGDVIEVSRKCRNVSLEQIITKSQIAHLVSKD